MTGINSSLYSKTYSTQMLFSAQIARKVAQPGCFLDSWIFSLCFGEPYFTLRLIMYTIYECF